MNEEQRRAIVAEVVRWSGPDGLEPYQFTVYDYMKESGLSAGQARTRLGKLVTAGRLQSAMVTHKGKRVRAFWRPEDEPKE